MKHLLAAVICALALLGCTTTEDDYSKHITSCFGKQIILPEKGFFTTDGTDTIDIELSEYKIIRHISPEECIKCNMNLNRWHALAERLVSVTGESTSIPLIISPPKMRYAIDAIKNTRNTMPIYIDITNEFGKQNADILRYDTNTFLANSNNEIVLIGDPTADYSI